CGKSLLSASAALVLRNVLGSTFQIFGSRRRAADKSVSASGCASDRRTSAAYNAASSTGLTIVSVATSLPVESALESGSAKATGTVLVSAVVSCTTESRTYRSAPGSL